MADSLFEWVFAENEDSVSGLVGVPIDVLIEDKLANAGITYRARKQAKTMGGFDPAPAFIIPDEFTPRVVIEAKLAEDDKDARDLINRVERLAQLSRQGQPEGLHKFEVIACIAGRGFALRREGIKKLLLATRGKLFTLSTLDRLIECTKLREFSAK